MNLSDIFEAESIGNVEFYPEEVYYGQEDVPVLNYLAIWKNPLRN